MAKDLEGLGTVLGSNLAGCFGLGNLQLQGLGCLNEDHARSLPGPLFPEVTPKPLPAWLARTAGWLIAMPSALRDSMFACAFFATT